jgi:EpsD family peptidyl-prolyl cis-trans isomerase
MRQGNGLDYSDIVYLIETRTSFPKTVSAAVPWRAIFVGIAVLILAAGCGKDDRGSASATQVVARVNADEITVHQVNAALAPAVNAVPAERAEQARRRVLDRLVEQELARQQAVSRKLDRTPAVQLALDAARREILARAYLQQVVAAQPKPTAAEIRDYYAAHPELFARRRLYSLEEIAFDANATDVAGLREKAAAARSMKEIAEWLSARKVKYAVSSGVRAAEQLPMELLPTLQETKAGEIRVFESGAGHRVIRVVASQLAPVDEAQAAPRIRQYLSNRHASEAIAADLKRLKSDALIEYVGAFADASPAASPNAPAATQAAQAVATSTPLPQESIEKGVGGLK